jgi:hypothetical protein
MIISQVGRIFMAKAMDVVLYLARKDMSKVTNTLESSVFAPESITCYGFS